MVGYHMDAVKEGLDTARSFFVANTRACFITQTDNMRYHFFLFKKK